MTPQSTRADAGGQPAPRTENLALLFQELLTAVVRIRANRQAVPDLEAFRAHVRNALRTVDGEAQRRGYSGEEARLAVLAVVAFLDETILNSANPAFRDWPRRPLQEELFGGHVAGETFFQNIRQLLTQEDSRRNADVLEIYQLCLLLGYRGRYSAGREGDLKAISDRIADKIHRVRGSSHIISMAYVPPAEAIAQEADPWAHRLLYAAVAVFVVVVILFVVYKLSLDSGLAELRAMAATVPGGLA